jgi:hypothetical protein
LLLIVVQTSAPKPDVLMLDAAIDKYLAKCCHLRGKTQNPYGYTMQQFYASGRNKPLAHVNR